MRPTAISLLLITVSLPQSLAAAADVAISCTFTNQMMVIHDQRLGPLDGTLRRQATTEIANFTISDTALTTTMAAPCNRISGEISGALVNVSCSFLPNENGQMSIKIRIDRQMGTISETWSTNNTDGSKSDTFKDGTCTKRQSF